jgi:hypothetical protein
MAALASSSAAAYAWPLLKRHIARHTETAPARAMLRRIPGNVTDELLLRECLQLNPDQIAETTGSQRPQSPRQPRAVRSSARGARQHVGAA